MALTQTDLDALDLAISKSELEVEFEGGRRVRYRSISELLAARNHVAGLLATATTPRRGGPYRYTMTTSRGD
jgi:hypothetical protein